MARFKARELDVLVATTVIEVGVDVPNATVMIVQEADRFGLAQLHQLRGRVGRGAEQSYCLLVSRAKEELTESAHARLQALCETSDGFELAEVDLDLRGGGALLGTRQSGLSDLHFAQLHQLRGRVGRGAEQSYCLLVSRPREELTETAVERLEAMVETTDGFELAERDLEIRGEGQLLGARQSGFSDLRFVRLRRDQGLLERARDAARSLDDEGLLAEEVDRLLGRAEHLGES